MFRFTIRDVLWLMVVVGMFALPAFPQEKADPSEALIGEWEIVEMTYRRTVQDFGGQPGGWFRFGKPAFVRFFGYENRQERREHSAGRYVTNGREIDIWQNRTDKEPLKALYEFKDGKLRIIWGEGDYDERPIDFDPMKDLRLTLFVLKKVEAKIAPKTVRRFQREQ